MVRGDGVAASPGTLRPSRYAEGTSLSLRDGWHASPSPEYSEAASAARCAAEVVREDRGRV